MKTWAGLVFGVAGYLALAGMVLRAETPVSHMKQAVLSLEPTIEDLPAYDNLQEAAVHAIARDYQCSHAYECAGVIAQRPDGKYVVGPVHSDYAGDHVHVPHGVPAGWRLIADQHTHPCLAESHEVGFFSPDDLQGDISEKLIGIMGDLCTGEVHLFNPASDVPNAVELPGNAGVFSTKGHIIGKITVDGKSMEPDTGI